MEVNILKGPLVDNELFLNLQSLFKGLVTVKSGMKFNFIDPSLEYEEGLDEEEVEELTHKKTIEIEIESTQDGFSFNSLLNMINGIAKDYQIINTPKHIIKSMFYFTEEVTSN